MAEEPSNYDRIQDQRLDELESLVSAEYEPPEGAQYSFPIANQGITQEQFRLMHLGQANGMIHGNNGVINDSPDSTGYRYYLEGHDSDSETNQRNTLILRAGTSAESIVEGFYHRLTEDMELPFPSVTRTTTYHVTLTYDPRRFKTDPVRVEVWDSTPPTTHGQIHVLLHTVERKPSQLLSQATITRYRQYTAGIISVQNVSQLPDPDSLPAGTLAIPSSAGGQGVFVRSNTSPKRWLNTLAGEWQNMEISQNLGLNGTAVFRRTPSGIDIYLQLEATSGPTGNYVASFPESSGIQFKRSWYMAYAGAGDLTGVIFNNSSYTARRILANGPRYIRFSGTIPDYVLNGL